MLISDRRIKELCNGSDVPMISPFTSGQVRLLTTGVPAISFGTSSFGYDVSLSEEIVVFTNVEHGIVDPKRPREDSTQPLRVRDGEDGERYVVVPPNSYALGYTNEYFRMPKSMTAIVIGKSTYARSCIQINCTPIEAGFEGQVVVEISNLSNSPARVYVNEGIAQFLFFESEEDCAVSYADRGGKYQGQTGLTHSRV